MKNLEITLDCCFCSEEMIRIIGAEDWWVYGEGIDEEGALCPHHAIISDWINSCCPGCAGGWHDCLLWKSFAYRERTITDEQLKTIEEGVCPFRHNGTLVINKGKIEELDISERASKEASKALVDAIKEFIIRYP